MQRVRPLRIIPSIIVLALIPAAINPAPQTSAFQTSAKLSVDKDSLSLSSVVAIREERKYPAGYAWVRIHFYPFPMTPADIAAARTGDVLSLDKQVNRNSYDPKVHTSAYGVIQLSVDKDFKVWQVDMSVPGHSCTIAPFEKDIQSFLQDFRYDGKTLRLKSKGSYLCDLKAVGAGEQHYCWDFDVTLPVFLKPNAKK